MSKRMNYKNFKKVHEDANSATLQHPEGHTIRIAKGALSDHVKKQLGALKFAEGGEVETKKYDWAKPHPPTPGRDPTGNRIDEYNPPESESNPRYQPTPSRQPANNNRDIPDEARKAIGYANGGMSMPDGTEMQPSQEAPAPDMNTQVPQQQTAPQGPTNPPIAQPQAPQAQPSDPVDYSASMNNAVNEQKQGIQGEAAAAGQQGKAESKASQGQMDAQQQLIKYAQDSYAKLEGERQQMRDKIANGEIDPNRYMKNHSKVQVAIGLILGGLGGTSSASDFLQQQIGKDIDAQKSQIANNKDLLANTMQQFGNMEHLTDHLRVMQSDLYSAKLKKAAADTMDPMAKARALQEAGKLDMQVAPIQAQMAQRQAVFRGMQQGSVNPAQAVPFLVPQEHQKEVYSEIKKAQDVEQLEKPILENFDRAAKENTIARTGAGMLRTPPSVQTLSAMYLPMIHDAEGRVNEYEAKTLHDLTPAPGDTEAKIAAKRMGLIQFMTQKRATPTADSFGIRIPKSSAGNFHKR